MTMRLTLRSLALATAAATFAFFVSGAAAAPKTVPIDAEGYEPAIASDLEPYTGRSIRLTEFVNEAKETSVWHYGNEEVRYEASPTLRAYLTACFAKALRSGGVAVKGKDAPIAVPEFRLTFTKWTPDGFKCRVTLLKNGAIEMEKEYAVFFEEPGRPNPVAPQERAYRDVDAIVLAVFGDAAFRNSFLK